jgi:hypothetical protein
MTYTRNGHRYMVDSFGCCIRLHENWEEEWHALKDWRK